MKQASIAALLATSALGCVMAIPGVAFAQEATSSSSADDSMGDEIIVQARRKDESAQDVPLVVNAVTSESLDKLNIRDLRDVTSIVPGLNLTSSANGIGAVATLRGVNFDVNVSGNNGTVEFYLNDQPITSNVVLQAMYDIGQVEVLRGPQGTLRGRASPSGSITVTTRKPDLDEFGGNINATVASHGTYNFNGAVNLPIFKDVLALRVAGLVEDTRANQVYSINAPNVDPYSRSRSVRATLLFKPIQSIELIASYQRFENNTQVFDQVESANFANSSLGASPVALTPSDRASVTDIPRLNQQLYDVYNLRAEWKFAGQKLSYVGGISDQYSYSYAPNDIGNFFGSNFPGLVSSPNDAFATGFATVPNFQTAAQHSKNDLTHQTSHELRLSSDERLFGMVDYVVGGQLNSVKGPFNVWAQTPIFIDSAGNKVATPANFFRYSNSNVYRDKKDGSEERSLFGNVTVHFGEATEVSGGLRYINYKNTTQQFLSFVGAGGVTTVPLGPRFSEKYNPVIYSFSAKHRFNDNLMVYASTGSSWRASAQTNGIIDRENAFPWGYVAGLRLLAPETSKSYEIGFKSEWFDKKLLLNLSYYHQDFKNYFYGARGIQIAQRTAVPAGGSLTGPNAGDTYTLISQNAATATNVPVKVDGVEAEFAFRPMRGLNFSGSASYSLAKIKNGVVPCNLPVLATSGAGLVAASGGQQVATCTANFRAGFSAPFSANLQSEYTTDITHSIGAYVRALVSYYGNSQNDPTNPVDDVKSYGLVNLYAGLRDQDMGWELTAYVKNVFNTERVLSRDANPLQTAANFLSPGFANLGGFPQTTTYRGITMTPPREFGLTLRYAIGSR